MFETEIDQIRQLLTQIKTNQENIKHFQSIDKHLDTIQNVKVEKYKEYLSKIASHQSNKSEEKTESEEECYRRTRHSEPQVSIISDSVE